MGFFRSGWLMFVVVVVGWGLCVYVVLFWSCEFWWVWGVLLWSLVSRVCWCRFLSDVYCCCCWLVDCVIDDWFFRMGLFCWVWGIVWRWVWVCVLSLYVFCWCVVFDLLDWWRGLRRGSLVRGGWVCRWLGCVGDWGDVGRGCLLVWFCWELGDCCFWFLFCVCWWGILLFEGEIVEFFWRVFWLVWWVFFSLSRGWCLFWWCWGWVLFWRFWDVYCLVVDSCWVWWVFVDELLWFWLRWWDWGSFWFEVVVVERFWGVCCVFWWLMWYVLSCWLVWCLEFFVCCVIVFVVWWCVCDGVVGDVWVVVYEVWRDWVVVEWVDLVYCWLVSWILEGGVWLVNCLGLEWVVCCVVFRGWIVRCVWCWYLLFVVVVFSWLVYWDCDWRCGLDVFVFLGYWVLIWVDWCWLVGVVFFRGSSWCFCMLLWCVCCWCLICVLVCDWSFFYEVWFLWSLLLGLLVIVGFVRLVYCYGVRCSLVIILVMICWGIICFDCRVVWCLERSGCVVGGWVFWSGLVCWGLLYWWFIFCWWSCCLRWRLVCYLWLVWCYCFWDGDW